MTLPADGVRRTKVQGFPGAFVLAEAESTRRALLIHNGLTSAVYLAFGTDEDGAEEPTAESYSLPLAANTAYTFDANDPFVREKIYVLITSTEPTKFVRVTRLLRTRL